MLGKGLESLIPKRAEGESLKSEPQVAGEKRDKLADASTPSFSDIAENKEKGSASDNTGETDTPITVSKNAPPRMHKITPHATAEGDAVFHIEVQLIKSNPHQPRRDISDESLRELAESIREFGIIQPLVVSKKEKEVPSGTEVEYELIAGERRLLAAKMLGLERVPVIIRRVDRENERLEMAVIENLQREDLNPIEVARAFARLQDEFRLTQREISRRLGKSRESVANTLRLLDLPSYIQDALERGDITESHGRLLLSVTEPRAQEALFRDLVDKHLTTRELRGKVESLKRSAAVYKSEKSPPEYEILALEEQLSAELGAPVKIERHGETGKITIIFYSQEELRNIIERLGKEEK